MPQRIFLGVVFVVARGVSVHAVDRVDGGVNAVGAGVVSVRGDGDDVGGGGVAIDVAEIRVDVSVDVVEILVAVADVPHECGWAVVGVARFASFEYPL